MKKETKKEIFTYLIIIVFVVLLRTYIITPVRVNGSSMNTTLQDGEIMILNKIDYRFNDIKRFDIVVIKTPTDKLIKRVIGLPGETLEIKNNILYINEKEVKEEFLKEKTEDFTYHGKIANNCYFVMGDNRDDSLDSRYFGCFDKNKIMGKTNFVLFPFNKFGNVK